MDEDDMGEDAKDEGVAGGPANKSGSPPSGALVSRTQELVIRPAFRRDDETADETADKTTDKAWNSPPLEHAAGGAGSAGLLTAIAALVAAGLTGIAAIIRAWAQLLRARADMIRARSGQPTVEVDQGGPEPGDGPNGGAGQTGA